MRNDGYTKLKEKTYLVMYSFLNGIELSEKFQKLNENTIKQIAFQLRKMHQIKLT